MKPDKIRFQVDRENAPYVRTKPFHKSQRVIAKKEDGSIVFEIEVVINHELHRVLFGFANSITVLSPKSLVDFMAWKLSNATKNYNQQEKGLKE